eukprot:GFUD01031533.1.p1 GENE.GFUD01031533.1~~GFUD01031533.1.p1  ORF type:complete len:277 (+),score=86.94 GFUD01031533.1:148-978(+)
MPIGELFRHTESKTVETDSRIMEDIFKGVEKRISQIESKLFQTMAQNEDLVKKVEALEEIIESKETQINYLLKHTRNDRENIKSLEVMFKDVLDESENLAFSVSMLEQKEKESMENIRALFSGFRATNEKIDNVSKGVKEKEIEYAKKNQDTMDKIERVETENKKILEYMDELLLSTVTLVNKTKEDKSKSEMKSSIQDKTEKEEKTGKELPKEPTPYQATAFQTLYSKQPSYPLNRHSPSTPAFFPASPLGLHQTAQHYGSASGSYSYYPWSQGE